MVRGYDQWRPLPLDKTLFANLPEGAVTGGYQAALENGFINELGGHLRFAGLTVFADFGDRSRVYLNDFRGDLIAVNAKGHVRILDKNANVNDVTEVPVAGGRRAVFAKSDKEIMIAAGGPIVRLRGSKTELLSSAAPNAALIGWLDNFTIAVEINSGRFFHSPPGQPDKWDPLDTFAADGNPDNINALLVTPSRELLLGGEDSIEQFERAGGTAPFARRWAIGSGGVKAPYVIAHIAGTTWCVNRNNELVSFAGQVQEPKSDDIGLLLSSIDDWTDAWMSGYPDRPLHIAGQKFIIIQAPNATNIYGTKGVTIGVDYRYPRPRFFSLYGWDADAGTPTRWPGWSHWSLWDKVFIGGEGKVYVLDPSVHRNGTDIQRWLVRTSYLSGGSGSIVKAFRLRLNRGQGNPAVASKIRVRCSRDGRPFGAWIERTMGLAGQREQFVEFGNFGAASTHQFEISSTDDTDINLIGADVKTDPIGH